MGRGSASLIFAKDVNGELQRNRERNVRGNSRNYSLTNTTIRESMVVWLRDWIEDQIVASSIPRTIVFLTNRLIAMDKLLHVNTTLFTRQHKLAPAGVNSRLCVLVRTTYLG